MGSFIIRRLFISLLVLLGATFIVFVLTANAGDPRTPLYQSTDPTAKLKIASLTRNLKLNVPVVPRYFLWLGGAVQCLWGHCELGQNVNGSDVGGLLVSAMGATLRLVLFATIIAMFVGIGIGLITALRQYSGLDYTTTFLAFLFFALPVFWIAVLLKLYFAIKFNSWLESPTIPVTVTVLFALLGGLIALAVVSGGALRKLYAFAGGAAAVALICLFFDQTKWFAAPGIGVIGMIVGAALSGVVGVTLFSGFRAKQPMYAAGITAAVGVVTFFLLSGSMTDTTALILLLLLVGTLAISGGIGAAVGGLYRRQAIKVAMLTGLGCAMLIFFDHVFAAYAGYAEKVRGIVIGTIGSNTPNFTGTFWENFLDQFGHLLLPSLALMLISLATYTRYTRGSMLEVMNMDYVRTARSKGLTERTVVLRHAFRNALIPVTTIVALDFGGVIGGAIITETVFGWSGMGKLFNDALKSADNNTVMGFFLITGASIVVFNMIADIAYGFLDPRIRLS
ncbi:MAG: ABC transporter permease [Nakamurella sp.]